jgi:hypothetical protein
MNRLSRRYFITTILLLSVIFGAAPLHAADGQLEINQACAVNTGCFPGDAPGFPVTITTPGSYRLTGNLDLSAFDPNLSGIQVNAPAVTVDLGGFHIAGATTCSGSGASISCFPSFTGGGSAGVLFQFASGGVVQNGIVRNMKNLGIFGRSPGLHVQNITAIHNGGWGIRAGRGALVENSVAIENFTEGIKLSVGSAVHGVTATGNGTDGFELDGATVSQSTATANGRHGFSLRALSKYGKGNLSTSNEEPDSCGGGICTERKRMYFTTERVQGNAVLEPGRCASGFRVASMTDFFDIGRYDYDYILGVHGNQSDPAGMPLWDGWVRPPNVNTATAVTHPDNVSCSNWGSSDSAHTGLHMFIRYPKLDGSTPLIGELLGVNHLPCGNVSSVTCVEIP